MRHRRAESDLGMEAGEKSCLVQADVELSVGQPSSDV